MLSMRDELGSGQAVAVVPRGPRRRAVSGARALSAAVIWAASLVAPPLAQPAQAADPPPQFASGKAHVEVTIRATGKRRTLDLTMDPITGFDSPTGIRGRMYFLYRDGSQPEPRPMLEIFGPAQTGQLTIVPRNSDAQVNVNLGGKDDDGYGIFDSPGGGCTVTISGSAATGLRGTFACTGLVRFGELIDASGTFEATPGATPPAACQVEGRVLDASTTAAASLGARVPSIHVRLRGGTMVQDTATDANGHYAFPPPVAAPGFDPALDTVTVTLIAADGGHKPSRFQLLDGSNVAGLRTEPFRVDGSVDCTRDFDIAHVPGTYQGVNTATGRWPAIIAGYQRLVRDWEIADSLGVTMDYGLPLRVVLWCGEEPEADWYSCPEEGAALHYDSRGGRPSIVALPMYSNPPGDGLDHEFGHAFLFDAHGNASSPAVGGGMGAHHGYYVNRSTGSSWNEGWADFFALLSARARADEARGAFGVDYEVNIRAWEAAGQKEAKAVASLLLDFVDGPADRATVKPFHYTQIADSKNGVVAGLALPDEVPEGAQVKASFIDAAGNDVWEDRQPVVTERVGPGGSFTSVYFFPPPDLKYDRVVLNTVSAAPVDDDPISVTPRQLWDAIAGWPGPDPAYPHVETMEDLHSALTAAFRGDRDRNGKDDVDEAFVAHGFFADTAGNASNRSHDPDEAVGPTSHFAEQVPGGTPWPEMIPRHFAPPPEEEMVRVDTHGVPAQFVIQVTFPTPREDASFGYVVEPDERGRIHVQVPAGDTGARITIAAVADGHRPQLVARLAADAFWAEASTRPFTSFMAFDAPLEVDKGSFLPGSPSPAAAPETGAPTTPGDVRRLADWIGLGLALLAAAAAFWLVTRRGQRRR